MTGQPATLPLVAITHEPIDVAALIAAVSHARVGAISTFLGTVREVNDHRPVTGIDYEGYEPMAVREMQGIADELVEEWPGLRIAMIHRLGTLQVGDVSVAIACAHARRAPSADAMRRAIESLKARVPIWKREHYVDGEWTWVDPTNSAAPMASQS